MGSLSKQDKVIEDVMCLYAKSWPHHQMAQRPHCQAWLSNMMYISLHHPNPPTGLSTLERELMPKV